MAINFKLIGVNIEIKDFLGSRQRTMRRAVITSLKSFVEGNQPSSSILAQQCRAITTSATSYLPVHIEDEIYNRQRQQIALGNRVPYVPSDAWVAPSAVLVGDVDLHERSSVWYNAVLRGDLNSIRIGAGSNIQDRTVIHAARSSPTGLPAASVIGQSVSVGQACVLRSVMIEDNCIVGDKCIMLEGSLMETKSILSPGSVVPPGRRIPSGQLWAGNPAKFVRDLSKDEQAEIPKIAQAAHNAVSDHFDEFLPAGGAAWREAEKLRAILKEGAPLKDDLSIYEEKEVEKEK